MSKKRQELWIARIKRADLKSEQYHNTRVCSDHFLDVSPSQLYNENNPDWAPSLKLGYETSSLGKRYKRAADRMVKKTARMDFASDIRVDDHFSDTEIILKKVVHQKMSLLKENLQMLVLKYKPT